MNKMPFFMNSNTGEGRNLSLGYHPSYLLDNDAYDAITSKIMKTGSWELELIQRALTHIKDGDIVLDIGANLGAWTVMLSMNSKITVHSFEPQRMKFYQLCANIWLNKRTNVIAHNYALSTELDDGKVMQMFEEPGNNGATSLMKFDNLHDTGMTATLTYLDNPSLRLDRVDFIKLDVEGYEEQVLKGGAKLIQKNRPIIFFESWDCRPSIRESLFKYFDEIQYQIQHIARDDFIAIPIEKSLTLK
jgi:FkbM family methyltransferase